MGDKTKNTVLSPEMDMTTGEIAGIPEDDWSWMAEARTPGAIVTITEGYTFAAKRGTIPLPYSSMNSRTAINLIKKWKKGEVIKLCVGKAIDYLPDYMPNSKELLHILRKYYFDVGTGLLATEAGLFVASAALTVALPATASTALLAVGAVFVIGGIGYAVVKTAQGLNELRLTFDKDRVIEIGHEIYLAMQSIGESAETEYTKLYI